MRYCSSGKAVAVIHGGKAAPLITGRVEFRQKSCGVLVTVDIKRLPKSDTGFFGFHIHEGESCMGKDFSDSGSHYNPSYTRHPDHAGDLPPLLLCGNSAHISLLTDRFRVCDIIGRTVIIHDMPDDFTSQPSGNAGEKIACGVIKGI